MDYTINYEDERFKNVESAKQEELNNLNNTYTGMINASDNFYQQQIDATKDYADKQTELQNQNTQFAIDTINQQKEQAEKDYQREQKGAYIDYMKQTNQYGANAQGISRQGLQGSGYSESSQVSMYNAYQNRVGTARDTFNRAVLNYDNSMREAQLANSVQIAQIAYQALQSQLQLGLESFQYKNNLLTQQLQLQQQTNDRYYSRWQDVLAQMNAENNLREQIRQYNEQFAYQKQRDKIADQQWKKEYELSKKKSKSSGGGSSSATIPFTQNNTPKISENEKKVAESSAYVFDFIKNLI